MSESNRDMCLGGGVAQFLVRWAAVRQPWVRFPPGTPPSAQQDELFTQTKESMKINPRMNTVLKYQNIQKFPLKKKEDEHCINACLSRKILNI